MGAKGFTDHCVMFSIVIINMVCGVLGALIFCLAVWMRLERDVKDWVRELEMFSYWNGLYILMAAGAIITIVAFCGCCGALVGNHSLMTINVTLTGASFFLLLFGSSILLANNVRTSFDYDHLTQQVRSVLQRDPYLRENFLIWLTYKSSVVVIVAFILELAGGIYLLVHGVENSKLQPYLERTMDKLIIDSNYNPTTNYYLQHVQEKIGCCGSYNYQDYSKNGLPISDSCRDAISGNVYQDGCVKKLSLFIEKRVGWISGIALFIGALQILLISLTCCYMKRIREEGDDGGPRARRSYIGVPTREKF